jgi:hypothetical protein
MSQSLDGAVKALGNDMGRFFSVVYYPDTNTLSLEKRDPSSTQAVVVDGMAQVRELSKTIVDCHRGRVLLVNGVAPILLHYGICDELCNKVPAIAPFDPKLGGGAYMVTVSHSQEYPFGTVIYPPESAAPDAPVDDASYPAEFDGPVYM